MRPIAPPNHTVGRGLHIGSTRHMRIGICPSSRRSSSLTRSKIRRVGKGAIDGALRVGKTVRPPYPRGEFAADDLEFCGDVSKQPPFAALVDADRCNRSCFDFSRPT